VSPTIKDLLGYVVNPPPGDPASTAMSDQVGPAVVTTRSAAAGTLPAADGFGGYTWIPSTGPGPVGPQGPAGPTGATGQGVPPGGSSGYILAKATAADYNTVWQPPGGGPAGPPGQGVPPGGTTGQALVKSANSDYATTWITPAGDLAGPFPNPTVPTVRGGLVPVARTDAAGGDLAGTYPNPQLKLSYVATLPASPNDGQEVYFLADPTNHVVWHLRYNAGSSDPTYKWEFVGGPAVTASDATSVNIGTANAWVGNYPPTFSASRAGVYWVELIVLGQNTQASTGVLYVNADKASSPNAPSLTGAGGAQSTIVPSANASVVTSGQITLTAGEQMRLAGYVTVVNMGFANKLMKVTPLRLA
jgi:hypothetical protein